MFTVYFSHATTTPNQPGLAQLVEAALVDCGAERTGLEAEIRLADGASLYLFGEDQADGMLAEFPTLTSEVAVATLAILRRTNSFMLIEPDSAVFVRAFGVVGEPRMPLAFDVEVAEVQDADAMADILREVRANRSPPSPRPKAPRTPSPRAGRGFSLTDFLFGKAV
ncbi:hypothetical protein ACIQTU_04845 [Brevundimonas sp. NPDC090276]|uniref:hypothetical protein n=1 Tax=Brevundimonas sp. NPDC090276 TaxID=3363956 RepID=UPI00383BB5F9